MHEFGHSVPAWAVLPFAVMLLGIAILPIAARRFWESNRNRALFMLVPTVPTAIYLLVVFPHGLFETLIEYGQFIALLGSLFVITGGIHISGDLRASPRVNTTMLALGAVLANLIGTTGASVLLIRILLRTNSQRKHVSHIPFFFILTVSNCGGLLTPMGDPPLFLGYLRGVPFTWTLGLWPFWVGAIGYLLALFYVLDARAYRRETSESIARDEVEQVALRLEGWLNVPLLLGVVGSVFLPTPWREAVMVGCGALSLLVAPKKPRQDNAFSYGPILEVAILFCGIFVTMVPALELLKARGSELGLSEPWQFFVFTGGLSSLLDNAPTYLTFLSTAQGLELTDDVVGVPNLFLVAISCAAVFMGGNTYIGNGPNFMVKAIAEEAKYPMPSFFGFLLRAAITLSPIYIAVVVYLVVAWT